MIALIAALLAPAALVKYPSTAPLLQWSGRRIPSSSEGWTIDWEGTQVRATLCNASVVNIVISDATLGGARFGVWINNSKVPNLRVATFFTVQQANMSYALASRRDTKRERCSTYTVRLLIEPSMIEDTSKSTVLTIEGFETDGHLVATLKPPIMRSMEILGDSLTAGYGAGFDLPHSQAATCDGGGNTDDQANTYGALLCANFSAQCTTEAVSGVTLYTDRNYNLALAWDFELGGMLSQGGWPEEDRIKYDASRFQPDAVLINLGENDWGGGKCGSTPGCPAQFQKAYVSFVTHISSVYHAAGKSNISFFLTIGPHEHGQSAAIVPAVSALRGSGLNAFFLNATVPDFGTIGCGGHPGITIHEASFQRAQPVIAAVMGW